MTAAMRPVYLQLRDRIAASILDGDPGEGGMLPSVRALAADSGANPLTVAKAYQWFQDQGLVEAQRGVGLRVADGARGRLRAIERERFLAETWPPVLEAAQRLEIDLADLTDRTIGVR